MDLDVNDIIVYDPISVQKAEVPKLSQTLGDNYNKGTDSKPVKLGSNEYTSTPIRDQRISNAINATHYSSTNSYYERTLQKVVDYSSLSMNATEKYYTYKLKPVADGTVRTTQYDSAEDYLKTTVSPNELETLTEDTEFTFVGTSTANLRASLYNNGGYRTFLAMQVKPNDKFKYVHDRMSLYKVAKELKYTLEDLITNETNFDNQSFSWQLQSDGRYKGVVSGNSASMTMLDPIEVRAGDVLDVTLYFDDKTYKGQGFEISFGDNGSYMRETYKGTISTLENATGSYMKFEALKDCTIEPVITVKAGVDVLMHPADPIIKFDDVFLGSVAADGHGQNVSGGPQPVTSYVDTHDASGNCYNFIVCDTYNDQQPYTKTHCLEFQFFSDSVSYYLNSEAQHNPHKVPSHDIRPYLVGKKSYKGVTIQGLDDPLLGGTSTVAFNVEKANDSLDISELTNSDPTLKSRVNKVTEQLRNVYDDGTYTNLLALRTLQSEVNGNAHGTGDYTIFFKEGGNWYVSTYKLAKKKHTAIGRTATEDEIVPDTMWTRLDAENTGATIANPLSMESGGSLPLNNHASAGCWSPYEGEGHFYECYYGKFDDGIAEGKNEPIYALNLTEAQVAQYHMPNFNQALVYSVTQPEWEEDWDREEQERPTDLAVSRASGKVTASLDDQFSVKIPSDKINFVKLNDGTTQLQEYSTQDLYHQYKNGMNIERWIKEKYVVFPFDVYSNANPGEPIDLSNIANLKLHPANQKIHLGVFTKNSVTGETSSTSTYFGKPTVSETENVLHNLDSYVPLAPWVTPDGSHMKQLAKSGGKYDFDKASGTDDSINIYDNDCHFFDFGYKEDPITHQPKYEYYFYIPLEVGEAANSNVQVHVVAINAMTSGSANTQMTNERSPGRPSTFENVGTSFITDIVGRIGGLTIVGSDDKRYADTFKQATPIAYDEKVKDGSEWLVFGIIPKISSYSNTPYVEGSQETIITDPYDIRGKGTEKVATALTNLNAIPTKKTAVEGKTPNTKTEALKTIFNAHKETSLYGGYGKTVDLNTYGTQTYKDQANLTTQTTGLADLSAGGVVTGKTGPSGGDTLGYSLPLQAVHNIHKGLKNQYPRIGYTTYMTLETIGGYYGENKRSSDITDVQLDREAANSNNDYGQEKIQIEPIYYDIMVPDVTIQDGVPDVTKDAILTAVDVYMMGMNGNYRRINANQNYYDTIGMPNVPMEVFYNNEYYIYDDGKHSNEVNTTSGTANLDQNTLFRGMINLEAVKTQTTTEKYTNIVKQLLDKWLKASSGDDKKVSPATTFDTTTSNTHYKATDVSEVQERIQMDSVLNDLSRSNYYPENYVIGNAQYLFLRERNRTYVGGPTNGLDPAHPDSQETKDYATTLQNAQKWYFGVGLPSSAKFVPCGITNPTEADFIKPYDEIDGMKYKHYILTCLNIIAKGTTWTLEYDNNVIHTPIVLHDIDDDLVQVTLSRINQINTKPGATSTTAGITDIKATSAELSEGKSNLYNKIIEVKTQNTNRDTAAKVETDSTGKTTKIEHNQFTNLPPFVLDTSINPTDLSHSTWVKTDPTKVAPGKEGSSHSGDTTNINTITNIKNLYPTSIDDTSKIDITGITAENNHIENVIPDNISTLNPLVPTKVNGTTINIKDVTPSELAHESVVKSVTTITSPSEVADISSVSDITPTPNVFTTNSIIPVITSVPDNSSVNDLTSYGTH